MCWQRTASRTTSEAVGREALEHLAHALRVQEFARLRDAGGIRLAIRVGRVGGVEPLGRGAEAVRGDGHGLIGHAQHTAHRSAAV